MILTTLKQIVIINNNSNSYNGPSELCVQLSVLIKPLKTLIT